MAAKAGRSGVTEIERKLDADPDFELPELTRPPLQAAQPQRYQLTATYFDSPDLRLIGQAITLRRRTGGPDDGWHLKRPRADGERDELHHPLGRSTRTVPRALRQLVEVHLRGAPLIPVVELATSRTVRRVLAEDGTVLAEVADDAVTASRPDAPPMCWRELEVELAAGDRALLAELVDRLLGAGARPSESRSKLGRALGDPPRISPALRPPGVRRSSAAAAILTCLDGQLSRLVVTDPELRVGADGAAGEARLCARRLSGLLTVFRPLFERAAVEPVLAELDWLSGVLAGPAELEAVRDRLLAALAEEPAELVLGPVPRRVTAQLRDRDRQARAAALKELTGPRYFALLDALDGLLPAPPLAALALERREMVLPGLVEQAWRRTVQLARAEAAAKGGDRERLRDELAVAAEQVRHAAKALVPWFGGPAAEFAARLKHLQVAAQACPDAQAAADLVLALATAAGAAGESGFSYGRLHARLQCDAEQAEQDLAKAWRRASRSELRRWLT